MPKASRRKIGKWSQGLERLFEDVLKAGVRNDEFRSAIDTRMVALAILGMVNWAPIRFGKEGAALSHIGGEFSRLMLRGIAAGRARTNP